MRPDPQNLECLDSVPSFASSNLVNFGHFTFLGLSLLICKTGILSILYKALENLLMKSAA